MSEQSRKVKNPLLTAAGQGFPFEDFSTNAVLMPVTPATPAILQDTNPEESPFVDEPIGGISSQQVLDTEINLPIPQNRATISQPIEPSRTDQPTRQSYFTSILSSLPNLSLSSITGETNPSQTTNYSQPQLGNPGASRDSGSYGFSQNPYGATTTSGPFLATDQSRDNSGQYPQGFNETGFIGNSANPAPPKPPPAAPPALPPSGGPGSYRLGNQRRLKYAPPPDLTSTNSKQYPSLDASNFLTPVQHPIPVSASEFLNPNATVPTLSSSHSSPGLLSNQNQNSGLGGLHSSQSLSSGFPTTSVSTIQQTPSCPPNLSSSVQPRQQASTNYNPGIGNWSGSTEVSHSSPREIPTRFPETATPQNTPANATFAGFASSYAANRLEPFVSNNPVDPRAPTISSGPAKFSEGLTFEVPSSAYLKSSTVPPTGCIIEPNIDNPGEEIRAASGSIEDSSFTPISAAKVTAKLEHFLAEREEDSTPVTSSPNQSAVVSTGPNPVQREKQISWSTELNESLKRSEGNEDLAEIDLTKNESRDVIQTQNSNIDKSEISSGLDFPSALISDSFARPASHFSTPAEANVSSKASSITESSAHKDTPETLPSATNFFDTGSERRTQESNYSSKNENPGPFYNPSGFLQNQRTTSSLFGPGTQTFGANVSSSFSTPATISQQSTTSPAQPVPTFYNPGEFITNNRESAFSTFPQQPYPATGISTPSPFTSVLSSSPPSFPTSDAFMAAAMPEPTGSATLNPVQMSVNPGLGRSNSEMVPPSLQSLAAGPSDRRMQYRAVYHHWFYRKEVESKVLWLPFSMQDSLSLEEIHNSSEITPETTVATDGGRYDVDILRRRRTPVYWTGNSTEVRRSSWFYKGSTESRYIPYEESTSARLEEEYKQACLTDNWNRRVELNNGEYIVFHSPTVQVHHMPTTSPELAASWGNSAVSSRNVQTQSASSYLKIGLNATLSNLDKPLRQAYAIITKDSETGTYLQGAASRPKVVKRGVDEFNIDEGEPEKVDHLLFLVHGIGSVCDLKFRTVEEVVDEFRSISLQLVQSHYRTASMHGIVNRIEVLPISWHTTLHSEDTGIDKKLRAITLESIPKLRHFTNDTLLDILFYTSPIYCQTIMQTVGNEMNRLYSLFRERNPNFGGSVYLGGHSLGSLILFDLLCHQKPPAEESRDETDPTPSNSESKSDEDTVAALKPTSTPILKRRLSKKVSYVMGSAGTGQPFINYPQLSFLPQAFFALGSPIGMFVTVRGIDTLGEDFALPTCPAFFNVFHPFDPVAYRVESLINAEAQKYRPMLIPHHKGRKRMHLELKETMARVGADIKQKLLDSVRSTWNSVYQLAMFHRPDNQSLEQEIEKVVEEQLQKSPSVQEQQNDDDGGADFRVGQLNGGRRIDYVLQEAPFEYINEYIFALTSHVCYWESEDTMLMILKEIYGTNGVQSDTQLPPQTMTIERVSPSPSIATISSVSTPPQNPSGATSPTGFDPTAPMSSKPVGPPPTSGFVRKT